MLLLLLLLLLLYSYDGGVVDDGVITIPAEKDKQYASYD